MDLNYFRQNMPQLKGLSDEAAIGIIQRNFYPEASPEELGGLLGYKPEPVQEPKRSATFGDYLKATDSSFGTGIAGIGAAAGTFMQAPAANSLAGVIGATALADRGLTWAMNKVSPGSAKVNDDIQEHARLSSRFAADTRDENAESKYNLLAKAGRYLEDDSRRVADEIKADEEKNNPELIRQRRKQEEAKGFTENVSAAFQNPLATYSSLVRSLPDMALGMGAGATVARAGASRAVAAGRVAAERAAQAGASVAEQKAVAKSAYDAVEKSVEGRVSTTGMLSEAGSSAMQAREGTYQQVISMPTDALDKNSERFRQIVDEVGGDKEKARKVFANELADQAPILSGIGTAAGTLATNKLFGGDATAKTVNQLAGGGEKMSAKEWGRRTLQDTLEEGLQGVPEDAVQYGATVQADPSKEFDPAGSFGQNVVAGFLMGGPSHGVGYAAGKFSKDEAATSNAKRSGGIVSRAGLAATPGAPTPTAPSTGPQTPSATTTAGGTTSAGGPAGTAGSSAPPAPTQNQAGASTTPQPAVNPAAGPSAPTNPAQTPIQASALSAIDQALEADKQRRRAAGEVVEDEVIEDDVVAVGDPPAAAPPDPQDQPIQSTQPASAGFSLPAFDNSPIPKMDPAEADEQRRQVAEAQDRRRKRVAALRLGAYNKNPMMEFLGRHGLQPEAQNEFAPGNTERKKAAVYGYGPVFRQNGKPLDLLLANAQDEGFLPPDASESDLHDLVSRTINGERVEPLYKAGVADDLMQRLAAEREAKEAATYDDYLQEQRQAIETGDFDPFDSIGATGYDFGDDDLADYAATPSPLQAEVSALARHYYDLGFDPDEVLERLSIETQNQPDQAFHDLAKSRFTQLIEQALNPGRAEDSAEQGGNRAVRLDAGPQSDAQADGGAAGGQSQAAAVTPPAAPAAATPKRADAIRAKLDSLKAQGFSQFTKSGGRTLLLNPGTHETVELTPAEMAVSKAMTSQAKAGLQALQGQRKPAQVGQQDAEVLQSYTPADVLAQEEQAGQQQAAEQAERDKAQAQARADDERKRIEQASYATADSFELGQNPLDSLTGQKDIFGAASPVAQDLAGEKINAEWTSFDPQSGTLGIPRAEMPQIKAEHRGAMMGFLKARGIDGQQETIPSTAIKPTQAEFSPAKVKKAIDYTGGNRSIVVSADGYVVDGHHQWLAAREQGKPIQAIRLDQNIGDVLTALKDMPSAQPEQAVQQDASRDYKSDMHLYPGRVLEQVGANGELSKLYAKAGVRGADAFGSLSADDRAAAYAAFVADGGKPADSLPKNYNDSVMEEERQIRRRQLQEERTITQANGKPFKTEAGAKAKLDEFDLADTHKIVSEGDGYALRQMPAAERAEVRRKAEGRESYMESQAAVMAEMGIQETADGEIDATEEQWDEIDQRIAERMGQKPVETATAKPELATATNPEGITQAAAPSIDQGPAAKWRTSWPEAKRISESLGLPVKDGKRNLKLTEMVPAIEAKLTKQPEDLAERDSGELLSDELAYRGRMVSDFVAAIVSGQDHPSSIRVGVISVAAGNRISAEVQVNAHGAMEIVIADSVVHAGNRHPDLTLEDWFKLPEITNSFDEVSAGRPGKNKSMIRVLLRKSMSDGAGYGAVYDFAAGGNKGRKKLNLVTYFRGTEKSLNAWWEKNKGSDPAAVPNLPEPASSAHDDVSEPSVGSLDQTGAGRQSESLRSRSDQWVLAQSNPALETIFDQLDGRTDNTQTKGKTAAAAHPQAERIQLVRDNFHDILINLMDSGRLKVNGQSTVTEENKSCL